MNLTFTAQYYTALKGFFPTEKKEICKKFRNFSLIPGNSALNLEEDHIILLTENQGE
jgi:hypothetical protein